MSRILLREIETLAEYGAIQDVAREVWRFEPRQDSSTLDLHVAGHEGVSALPASNLGLDRRGP